MAGTYWGAKYWSSQYWGADYWTEDATGGSGNYWGQQYWGSQYWGSNYWAIGDPGEIFQNAAGVRTLSAFDPVMITGPEIQPGTPSRTLTALVTATANTVNFTATLPTRTLTALNHEVDNVGYQLGDVNFTAFASSNIAWTDTVLATAPGRTLTAPTHSVNTGSNITVTVQSTGVRTLTANPHSVANPVVLNLTTPVKQLTAFNALTGIGTLVRATAPTRTLTARQPNVVAAGAVTTVSTTTPIRTLTAVSPDIEAFPPTFAVPGRTYPIDFIANDNAAEYPSFYLICQRSGFRVPVSEGLMTEWNGTIVRKESFERRHPQDLVRSKEDKQTGSISPEQTDRFVGTDVPTVTAADL